MKLKLTYSPEEAREADLIVRFTKALLSGSKVRRDKSKGSKLAVYVTTKERRMTNGAEKVKFDNAPGYPKDVKSYR